MTPTKYANLTNREVMDKLAGLTAKIEDGKSCWEDAEEASDTVTEVLNRLEAFDYLKTHPWFSVEEFLPALEEDWDSDVVSRQVIVLLENGEVSKDLYWKDKKTGECGWAYSSIKVTHWMPFIEPQKGGQQ